MQSRLYGCLVVSACLAAGCGNKDAKPASGSAGEPDGADRPFRVEFGDCADSPVAFESGPKPSSSLGLPDTRPAPAAGSPNGLGQIYNGVLGSAWVERAPGAAGSGGGSGTNDDGSKYGTIGHGATVHEAPASSDPARVQLPAPQIAPGQPTVTGKLDKAAVRKRLARENPKLQYCYEKTLLAKPSLCGTVTATFQIAADGTVASSTADGIDPAISSCIADVIKDVVFAKHKGAVDVTDTFAFVGSTAAPAAAAPPDAAPEADESGGTGTAMALDEGKMGNHDKQLAPDEDYRPGGHNALAEQRDALVACLAKQTPAYGVIVVDLTYHPTAATEATAHGDGSDTTLRCVADAARKIKPRGTASERCALAYGVMRELREAPGVDIGDAIALQGKPIIKTAAVAADPSGQLPIAELSIAASEPVTAPVAIRGPLVLRAAGATPMKVINRVIGTLIAAHRDVVLARQHDKDWDLVNREQLPVMPAVPVPVGSGRPHGIVSVPAGHDDRNDEHVVLSLLVTGKDVWVGLSRINEGKHVSLDQLAAALKEHKASAFFADRNDVEIAGDDTASYGQLVRAIDEAQRAGFVGWQLTRPSALSAHPEN